MALLFTTLLVSCAVSQENEYNALEIFTKEGCGHCAHAKKSLNAAGIDYIEYSVQVNQNGPRMFQRARMVGYKGKAFMPAIYYDSTLIYPARYIDTGYVYQSLNDALSLIKKEHQKGLIASKEVQIDSEEPTVVTDEDCEYGEDNKTYFVVSHRVKDKEVARQMVQNLRNNGYTRASFFQYEEQYLVTINTLPNKEVAQKVHQAHVKRFSNLELVGL